MDQLSLPSFNIQLKKENGVDMVFDQIRKKHIVLTPEEWVRQHFVNYLIAHLGYPRSLINVEQGLRYNSLLKRSDIVVYSRDGNPIMLVECKSVKYQLNKKVVEQALMYNKTIDAQYIIVANGLESACMKIDKVKSNVEFLPRIPEYGDL